MRDDATSQMWSYCNCWLADKLSISVHGRCWSVTFLLRLLNGDRLKADGTTAKVEGVAPPHGQRPGRQRSALRVWPRVLLLLIYLPILTQWHYPLQLTYYPILLHKQHYIHIAICVELDCYLTYNIQSGKNYKYIKATKSKQNNVVIPSLHHIER